MNEREQRRRDRYFAGMNARYARRFRIEALTLLERVQATGLEIDEDQQRWLTFVTNDPGTDVYRLIRTYADLADAVEKVPVRKRLRSRAP